MENNENVQFCNLLERLKVNKGLRNYDEAATKQAVVLTVLAHLGWDTGNIDEVYPEYTVEKRRVDYSLRLHGRNEFFLEVKRPDEDLEKHEEQLLNYAFREGVKLAGLTNGITWLFYLPLKEGSWKDRRFYAIDILEQEVGDVVRMFIDIMHRENVENGESVKNAEQIYTSALRQRTFIERIPEAWNRIIDEPDKILIEILADTTEKICGFKPSSEDIANFIYANKARLQMPPRMQITLKKDLQMVVSEGEREEIKKEKRVQNDTAVRLKIDFSEANNILANIQHKKFQAVLKKKWHANMAGGVCAQSVCWLYCWAKTGMKSEFVADESKKAFNAILDISYQEFDNKVDHKWAQDARNKIGDIEDKLASLLGRN